MRLGGTRRGAKVAYGFALFPGALQQHRAAAFGRPNGELVEGDDLAAGLEDASARRGSHAQRTHVHLRHLEDALVVSHGAHHHGQLADTIAARHMTFEASQRHGRTVGLGHEEASHDDLVELNLRTTGQELVKLDKKAQVDIVGLRILPYDLAPVLVLQIDALRKQNGE